DNETIENCYKFGGNDYVNKPFNHIELLARISFHIRLSDKEAEVKIREKELEYEANYDSLTQIYNRKMFNRLTNKKIVESKIAKKSFIFILLDIDYFKQVNDTYGHLVGDDILKAVSKIIKSHIRGTDIFARWGGEEFVITLDVDMKKGIEIAENLRKSIENTNFDVIKNLTCSFGVTEYIIGDTLDSMIKRADEALYKAKESGRNRVCQA
ncbi:MAG: diguanylate cyclase, partial [Sulfurimonas sp.]|nr:diguanylate cyclase [Sulfurimonas sp.]